MTSTQIRQSFLDFFKSKQHTIVPSSSAAARFAEPVVHERRHEPVRAHLPRPGPVPLQTRRAPPTPRNASAPAANTTTSKTSAWTPTTTRFSRCWAIGASAIISKRKPSNGHGNWSSKKWFGNFRQNASTPPSISRTNQGEPTEFDQEACEHLGAKFHRCRARPQGPHLSLAARRTTFG